jgi:hypothetical protein
MQVIGLLRLSSLRAPAICSEFGGSGITVNLPAVPVIQLRR